MEGVLDAVEVWQIDELEHQLIDGILDENDNVVEPFVIKAINPRGGTDVDVWMSGVAFGLHAPSCPKIGRAPR